MSGVPEASDSINDCEVTVVGGRFAGQGRKKLIIGNLACRLGSTSILGYAAQPLVGDCREIDVVFNNFGDHLVAGRLGAGQRTAEEVRQLRPCNLGAVFRRRASPGFVSLR